MIYCVVPKPLADELYPKLVKRYEDDDNVTVIVDRREADRRARGSRPSESDLQRRVSATVAAPASREILPLSTARTACGGPSVATATMKVVVHVDGGSRGNPGPAAAASVVSTPTGEVLDEASELLGRSPTTSPSTARCCSAWRARARLGHARSRSSTTPS